MWACRAGTEKTKTIDRKSEQTAGTQEETIVLSYGKMSDLQFGRGNFVQRKHTLHCCLRVCKVCHGRLALVGTSCA